MWFFLFFKFDASSHADQYSGISVQEQGQPCNNGGNGFESYDSGYNRCWGALVNRSQGRPVGEYLLEYLRRAVQDGSHLASLLSASH